MTATQPVVLAIDAGTTGVRTVAIDSDGRLVAYAYREFPQHFPRPGWVEHDAGDIWQAVQATLGEVVASVSEAGIPPSSERPMEEVVASVSEAGIPPSSERPMEVVASVSEAGIPPSSERPTEEVAAVDREIVAIGITNQRETVVAWDRGTGRPVARALVWQDRRTADRCEQLRAAGHEPFVRAHTGLVLDPYFSATKLEWLLTDGGIEPSPQLAFGTVDSWILWNLTGGTEGGVHATEPSNASRTLLFDIDTQSWSDELTALFGVPPASLPEVRPSSGRFGTTRPDCAAGLRVPVSGIAGDQQAALFGQACFGLGTSKNTYGTGSFVLVNLGASHPDPVDGLLTTVAWTIGDDVTYALEGSIFVTGAALQWLRDGLGIITDAAEAGPLAATVPDTDGVVFVPAFTGLGSPTWDPHARGTLLGLTRGTTRAHVVRAAIESMAWHTADVLDAITAASGTRVSELRVDGGASVMDFLCQFQADVTGVTVQRAALRETTALGAALLAGLAEGVWSSPADAARACTTDASFAPQALPDVDARRADWHRGVDRARNWAN